MIDKVLKQLTDYVDGKDILEKQEALELLSNFKEFLQDSLNDGEEVHAYEGKIAALVFKVLLTTSTESLKCQISEITDIIELSEKTKHG